MSHWMVMPSIDVTRNRGTSFDVNATNLSEGEARAEATRRNAVEKQAGNVGIDWFPAQDPMAIMAAQMGLSIDALRSSLT